MGIQLFWSFPLEVNIERKKDRESLQESNTKVLTLPIHSPVVYYFVQEKWRESKGRGTEKNRHDLLQAVAERGDFMESDSNTMFL